MNRHPIHALSDDLVESICAHSPASATFVGVKGHDHRWDVFGPIGQASRAASYEAFSKRLAELERDPPSDAATRLALRVHREYLDERIEFHRCGDPVYDLNNIASTFQTLTMVFDFIDVTSREGVLAAAQRLETFGEATREYLMLLAQGVVRKKVVARRQVLAAIEQGRAKATAPSFARAFVDSIDPALVDDPRLAARLELGVDAATRALVELTDWLESSYLPHAAEADGVGAERYERAMRRFLGAKIDPREAHAWGWDEIRRIEATMAEIAQTISPGATARAIADRLANDPAASLAIPEPFLEVMRERQSRALAQLDGTHFEVPEAIRRIDVKLAPAGGKPGAYYSPPAEDFSRAGTVWYSPGERTALPLWQEITTAYHEGFPGHHLQVAMQVLQGERLTRFQRLFADWAGHSEGWALYAEQLMLELGFFEKPEYVLGMYAGQLVRACRVVVDIGLHLELEIPDNVDFHPGARWTFDLAVELMRDRALLAPSVAESEVVRYLGWPAQAITYKLGQKVLLEVRAECMKRAGSSFDLKRFHSEVVGLGGVGLSTLRDTMLE